MLSSAQRRILRARAHTLKPVVTVAHKGLTTAVLGEIEIALNAHELIKVKLVGIERIERGRMHEQICQKLAAMPVQHIGSILVLWREKPQAEPTLSRPAPRQPRQTKKQAQAAQERRRRR